MGIGYALTEDYPLENGYPKVKYGTLGLIRATEAPEIETILVKKPPSQSQNHPCATNLTNPTNLASTAPPPNPANLASTAPPKNLANTANHINPTNPANQPAYGAKGVGELATIPTAPAIHGAYYRLDGKFRTKLPMEGTFYDK